MMDVEVLNDEDIQNSSSEEEDLRIGENIGTSGKTVPNPNVSSTAGTSCGNSIGVVANPIVGELDVFLDAKQVADDGAEVSEGNGDGEEKEDEEDNDGNNDEPRYDHTPSPPSSQGSLSSVEFHYRSARKLEKTHEARQSLDLGLVLSKDAQNLLEMYHRDQGLASRLKAFLIQDFVSFGHAQHVIESTPYNELLSRFKNDDTTVLLARLGKLSLDYLSTNEKLNHQIFVASNAEIAYPFDEIRIQPLVENLERVGYIRKEDERDESMDAEQDMPKIPPFSPCSEANSNKRNERPFPLSTEGLRNAYDHICREKETKKQIEKAGQCLFDDCFSEDEIRDCTLSGKKCGTKKTQCFDVDKLRSIKGALKWLLAQKEGGKSSLVLTVAALQDCMQTHDLRLTKDDEEYFNTKVLTEYAYRCRKRNSLNKNND